MKYFWIFMILLFVLLTAASAQIIGPGANIDIIITSSQTINDITLSNSGFSPSSPNGTLVGVATVQTVGQPFGGTQLLSDTVPGSGDAAKFSLTGCSGTSCNIVTVGVLCTAPPCTFRIKDTATQAGAAGSPFPKDFVISSSVPATNQVGNSVLTNNSLNTPTANNANQVIGDVTWPGLGATGSYSGSMVLDQATAYLTLTDPAANCTIANISQTNSVLLTCNGATTRPLAKLRVGPSNVAPGRYSFDLVHGVANELAVAGFGAANAGAAGCAAPYNHSYTMTTGVADQYGNRPILQDGAPFWVGTLVLVFGSVSIPGCGIAVKTAPFPGPTGIVANNTWWSFSDYGGYDLLARPAYFEQNITISVGNLAPDGATILAGDGNTLVTRGEGNLSWKGSNFYGGILSSGASITSGGRDANWRNVAQKAGVFRGGVTHIKYNTMLPAPAPTQRCQADQEYGQGIVKQVYAGDGQQIANVQTATDSGTHTWSFGPNPVSPGSIYYPILKDGVSVAGGSASILQFSNDGYIYARTIYYSEWYWTGTAWSLLYNNPPGFFREVTCPPGF